MISVCLFAFGDTSLQKLWGTRPGDVTSLCMLFVINIFNPFANAVYEIVAAMFEQSSTRVLGTFP